MTFDAHSAYQFSVSEDRDVAPFFAGRGHEIQKFGNALEGARNRRTTVFRVFQGAPGCGKTSLLNHLMDTRPADTLFAAMRREDLASKHALDARVHDIVASAHSSGSRIVARAGEDVAKRFKLDRMFAEIKRTYVEHEAKETRIVLYMDEAQTIRPSEQRGLMELHTYGLGFPSVLLLTGLGHTADKLRNAGISRLSQEAVTNMGPLSDAECRQSTAELLCRYGTLGSDSGKDRAIGTIAALAHGWPQHLCGAQKALCAELGRTGGEIEPVDWDRVRSVSDARRHSYYDARISGTPLGEWSVVTARVVAEVRDRHPADMGELRGLCRRVMERPEVTGDPEFDASPREFAALLIQRGMLSVAPDGRYDVAIPSMGDWLQAKIG